MTWNPGEANPKQKLFFASRALYTAYGGAKGGGKTWAVRTKAIGGALMNPGIRILILRRTYPELEENHIRPILREMPRLAAKYNASQRLVSFQNGSIIKFGHWQGLESELEYQGQEFDWIFIDEATQFTERTFHYLGGCLRGVNDFPKRMYLTCNPGGVGHAWVKRLFIDRDFHTNTGDPEADERPEDYVFIPATVEDNAALLKSSPGYLRMLAAMPEDQRAAYRYGDWNALGGSYFRELRRDRHLEAPRGVPPEWRLYRSLDYGLDMLAVLWIGVDAAGRRHVYREFRKAGLIVREAAEAILRLTPPEERIELTYAPPDLWSRQKDSGRTMEELFREHGLILTRAENDRAAGHLCIKEALAPGRDGQPGLMLSRACPGLWRDLEEIQADAVNPSDCAREPHGITHSVDALRYFCVMHREAAAEEAREWEESPAAWLMWGEG
ncbi:MAG: phage terminase large subunit [bacterium]